MIPKLSRLSRKVDAAAYTSRKKEESEKERKCGWKARVVVEKEEDGRGNVPR